MNRKTVVSIAAVAIGGLMLPAVASLKNRITRPVKVSGDMILIYTPISADTPWVGTYEFTDSGQASHAGRYSDTATGTMNLATGEFLTGSGTIVAADGDTLTWEVTADPTDTPNQVVYTGGTGRFQGVTGGFTAKIISVVPLGGNVNSVTLGLSYTGSGDITY